MENKNYLMVQGNIVTNVIVWNGNTDDWTPPSDATMLIQSETPARDWYWDDELKDFVLVEGVGTGSIGFTWDGNVLTTNQPKPENIIADDQPVTTGTQTL